MEVNNKQLYDRTFRKRLLADSKSCAGELGLLDLPPEIDIKVVKNSKDVIYLPIGSQQIDLSQINAATNVPSGTAGTAGSASTFFCFAGSFSSAGTASSLGCISTNQ